MIVLISDIYSVKRMSDVLFKTFSDSDIRRRSEVKLFTNLCQSDSVIGLYSDYGGSVSSHLLCSLWFGHSRHICTRGEASEAGAHGPLSILSVLAKAISPQILPAWFSHKIVFIPASIFSQQQLHNNTTSSNKASNKSCTVAALQLIHRTHLLTPQILWSLQY